MSRTTPGSFDSHARRLRASDDAAPVAGTAASLRASWRCGAGARLSVTATQRADGAVEAVIEWRVCPASNRARGGAIAPSGAASIVIQASGVGSLACPGDASARGGFEWRMQLAWIGSIGSASAPACGSLDVVELAAASGLSDASGAPILLTNLPVALGLQGGTYVLEEAKVTREPAAAAERSLPGRPDRRAVDARASERALEPQGKRSRSAGTP